MTEATVRELDSFEKESSTYNPTLVCACVGNGTTGRGTSTALGADLFWQ
jgi:hypothetical protein